MEINSFKWDNNNDIIRRRKKKPFNLFAMYLCYSALEIFIYLLQNRTIFSTIYKAHLNGTGEKKTSTTTPKENMQCAHTYNCNGCNCNWLQLIEISAIAQKVYLESHLLKLDACVARVLNILCVCVCVCTIQVCSVAFSRFGVCCFEIFNEYCLDLDSHLII